MTRIVIADDHSIVRDGLHALFSAAEDMEVVGSCVNGAEVMEVVEAQAPDLLVMDVKMPGKSGLEALRGLGLLGDCPCTILIAATLTRVEAREAMRLGAWGIVMKDQASRVILECIYAALDGEPWIPDSSMRRLLGITRGAEATPATFGNTLTGREVEIAAQAARGLSNKAIARTLGITGGTVKVHLHRIYQKLGVGNRVQLALHVDEHGLS